MSQTGFKPNGSGEQQQVASDNALDYLTLGAGPLNTVAATVSEIS